MSVPPLRLRLRGDCGPRPNTSGACQRGMVLRSNRSRSMSFQTAHAFAFSLATTLMAAIVIFRAGDGTLSVTPASEYDGDASPSSAKSTPSPHDGANRVARRRTLHGFRSRRARILLISQSRRGGGGGATVRHSHGDTTMIFSAFSSASPPSASSAGCSSRLPSSRCRSSRA
jgi:hypothetical protein